MESRMNRSSAARCQQAPVLLGLLLATGCGVEQDSAGVAAIHLARAFTPDQVEGSPLDLEPPEPIEFRFDRPYEPPERDEPDEPKGEEGAGARGAEEGPEAEDPVPDLVPTHGFEAFQDIEGLEVKDGLLLGRTGEVPVLRVEIEPLDETDLLHSIEVRMRVSAGATVGAMLMGGERFDRKEARQRLKRSRFWAIHAELEPGDELRTYRMGTMHGFGSYPLTETWQLLLQPTDVAAADFAIESVRLISRRQHLASVESGVSWQGLGEIYREALVLRSPETTSFEVELQGRPWLDLSVGTIQHHPLTFRVEVARAGSDQGTDVLRRTVTSADRWEATPIDLQAFAGLRVRLTFSLDSQQPGAIGLFGSPIIRHRGAAPSNGALAPRGVILILADTLRRDHLDAYGYERQTAPNLKRLAVEGALFRDNISQGTWTKVSVPSILSSIYPTSHGIRTAADRLPATVTTLAEVYQQAGYATLATSSVAFSGKMTNLQQGIDVLHERASVGDLGHSGSKTARVFVDRTLDWIETHHESPFFVFLHVFDPHSPFEPYQPYGRIWSESSALEEHEKDVEAAREYLESKDKEPNSMPRRGELIAAGIDPEAFVIREKNWYDESIRAMDVEVGRLLERLETLGLDDDVLIAFISDHGEEFLEHGRHFHGNTTYGEMTNVPLLVWGRKRVPAVEIEETVQSIDLMPTLLELSLLPLPDGIQGQSLVPLIERNGAWRSRPAFSEKRRSEFDRQPEPDDIDSFSIVKNGFRLVKNVDPPEGMAEYELFDHLNDPLNLTDLAAERPEVVAQLRRELELWLKWASASRIQGGEGAEELSEAELEQLRELGYVR